MALIYLKVVSSILVIRLTFYFYFSYIFPPTKSGAPFSLLPNGASNGAKMERYPRSILMFYSGFRPNTEGVDGGAVVLHACTGAPGRAQTPEYFIDLVPACN